MIPVESLFRYLNIINDRIIYNYLIHKIDTIPKYNNSSCKTGNLLKLMSNDQ
jgi:hypothetical protein